MGNLSCIDCGKPMKFVDSNKRDSYLAHIVSKGIILNRGVIVMVNNSWELVEFYSATLNKYMNGKLSEKGCNNTNVKMMRLVKPTTELLSTLRFELGFLCSILNDKYINTEHVGIFRMCLNLSNSVLREIKFNTAIEYALKTYKIPDITVVRAIQYSVNKKRERVDRLNKDIIPEYITYACLDTYYKLREKQGVSVLQDFKLIKDKVSDMIIFNDISKEDYLSIRSDTYKKHVEGIMKENGIWYDNVDHLLKIKKEKNDAIKQRIKEREEIELRNKIDEEQEVCYIREVSKKVDTLMRGIYDASLDPTHLDKIISRIKETGSSVYYCVVYRYLGGNRGMSYNFLKDIDMSTLEFTKSKSFRNAYLFDKNDKGFMLNIKKGLEDKCKRVRVDFIEIAI